MNFVDITKVLIYLHATLGGIALLCGGVALIAKKGKKTHIKTGKIFYYSMLSSAFTALILSVIPEHENPFLFTIGLFSSYFILSGYRALRFKKESPNLTFDKILSWILFFVGLTMIGLPIILHQKLNIVLGIFGLLAVVFSIQDLIQFKNKLKLKQNWLKAHLGKMVGGYIAATTAFIVVNNIIPGVFGWFAPGLVGGVYIYYWIRKLNRPLTK